jgi:hypothetical protein
VDPLAEETDGLIDVHREGAQPGDPLLVVLHRLEGESVGELGGGLDAFALVDRE